MGEQQFLSIIQASHQNDRKEHKQIITAVSALLVNNKCEIYDFRKMVP